MMELNYLKDLLFDVISDSNEMNVSDIKADDRQNTFTIQMADRSRFVVECRKADERIMTA